MAHGWLPNCAEFFVHSVLGRLTETCERQRPSQRRDAADFYLRRVAELRSVRLQTCNMRAILSHQNPVPLCRASRWACVSVF